MRSLLEKKTYKAENYSNNWVKPEVWVKFTY